MKNRGQSFLGGAAILMAAAFIVKVIGALFKIPLAAVLGGEGMGYYMTAYSFFNPVFALSAAGFPIAVSRLTAAASAQRRFDDKRRILNTALLLFSLS
ncbi:MAG: oligosaccharide flippase family protein, partial [Oscillospiraceae bacterium]|nr:oligosaccharide flippase family protein [Oscillospiraceae bacterium]